MPFTFSHPAIVLPLTRLSKKWVSTSGLIIGSLTPDFEYFIRMQIKSEYSHTVLGLLTFNLPMGLVIAFIYHNWVRNALISNLPYPLYRRFFCAISFNWNSFFKKNWLVVMYSILIGAASHIFWDSFTHDHGFFVERSPFLKQSVSILNHSVPILKLLQHGSTCIGAIIIGLYVYWLPKSNPPYPTVNWGYWFTVMGTSLILLSTRVVLGLSVYAYGNLIVTGISTTMIGLILASLLYKKP